MKIPRIDTMRPEDILVKEAFKRTLPSDRLTPVCGTYRTGNGGGITSPSTDPLRFELLTQSDFLR